MTVVLRDGHHIIDDDATRPDVIVYYAPGLPVPYFEGVPVIDFTGCPDMRSLREAVRVATRADLTKARFADQVNAQPDLNAIEASRQQFLAEQGAKPGSPAIPPRPTGLLDAYGNPIMDGGTPAQPPEPAPPMSAVRAQNMKTGTYRVLNGKFGELGSASVEAQKALAYGLKEEIADQFPEIDSANKGLSGLYDLQPYLERAVNRMTNQGTFRLMTGVVGGTVKALTGSEKMARTAAVLNQVLDDPMVKSRLAIAISRGGKIPYAQALARVAAYSSSLASFAGAPSANSSANGVPPTQSASGQP